MVNRKHKPVQSLQRGLALFQAIAERKDGMSLKELAAVIDCSAPATYHLVGTLVDCGFAERVGSPVRYIAGDKWLRFTEAQRHDRFYRVVYEQMRAFSLQLESVSLHFSEYIGESVVVRAYSAADAPGQVREQVNHVLPPYTSAGSLAHLAFWPQELSAAYQSRYQFEVYGLPYWGSRKAFDEALKQLRADGIYEMPGLPATELKLSLPLFLPGGGLAAALTIHWKPAGAAQVKAGKGELLRMALELGATITRDLSL